MSDQIQQLAEQLAAQGRAALVEHLRSAYADAAAAHADIVSIDPSRIEALVQRAAQRADGVQWRRALASVASERLGISVIDALSHPAVARAQEIADAPSYEKSLASLLDRPVSVPAEEPLPAARTGADASASDDTTDDAPGDDDRSDELEPVEADDEVVDLLPPVDPGEFSEPEEGDFSEQQVAQADAPTRTYDAVQDSEDGGDDESEQDPDVSDEAADLEDSPTAEPEEEAPRSPLAGLAKAKVVDPHATQIHDMAAEFRAQDEAAQTAAAPADAAATPPRRPGRPPAVTPPEPPRSPGQPGFPPEPPRYSDQPGPPPAQPEDPGYPDHPAQPDDPGYADELRVPAIHLGGVANLPTRGEPLDLRISEAGLDILQADEEILGRLQWSDIGQLEAGNVKGRLLGKGKSGSRLVVRTRHGDASFEIPDMSGEELRLHIAELSARYGR